MATVPQFPVALEPLGDRVIVMPIEAEKKTKSGIYIPESASGEKKQEGIVVALGDGSVGKDSENPQKHLQVGQTVLFGKYAGDDLKVKDVEGKEIQLKVLHLDSVACRVRQMS